MAYDRIAQLLAGVDPQPMQSTQPEGSYQVAGDVVRWPGTPLADMQRLGYGSGQFSGMGTGATFLDNLLKQLEAERQRSNIIPLIRPPR